jgi:hypothetical protein
MAFTRLVLKMELAESSEVSNLHLSINNQQIESNNIDNWNQVVSMKEGTSTTCSPLKIYCRLYHFGKQGNSLFSYGYCRNNPAK